MDDAFEEDRSSQRRKSSSGFGFIRIYRMLGYIGGRAHPEALSCERRRAGRKTWAIFENERHFGAGQPPWGQASLADFCGSWVVKEAITHYQVACDSIRTIRDFEIAGGACSSKRTG